MKAESVKEELDNVEYQGNLSNFGAASMDEVDSHTKEEICRNNTSETDKAPQTVKDTKKSYECPDCDFVATGSDNTKLYEEAVKHKRSLHQNVVEQEFNCDACAYKSKEHSSLVRHMRTHIAVKTFPCEECTLKTFSSKESLNQHRKYVHLSRAGASSKILASQGPK